jgi:hypothetical protein
VFDGDLLRHRCVDWCGCDCNVLSKISVVERGLSIGLL